MPSAIRSVASSVAMLSLADAGAALNVPLWLHFVLWPSLVGWVGLLIWHRGDWAWLRSTRLAPALLPAVVGADLGVLIASHDLPTGASSFGLVLVWLAWLLSITAYFVLRGPDRGDPGGDADEGDPEPPWWPDFERQLRDYMRSGPRAPASRPRTPAGVM